MTPAESAARKALADHDATRCGHRTIDYALDEWGACTKPKGHAPGCHVGHEPEEPWTHLRAVIEALDAATARIEALERVVEAARGLDDAITNIRDSILHGRYQLESVLDGDQTNAVLAVLDYGSDDASVLFAAALAALPPETGAIQLPEAPR